ncbi:hypothetical protein [Nocardioides sp. GXQ0305]|uniref:hypothetical protein n=1 Tax=Nocardioides sp. GXQ0305 TaxID=3423912 RepID=UPI003D7E9593
MATTSSADAKGLLARAAGVVGQVLVPLGAVTGVLYYFGYVRERALYAYFGVPVGTLDLTTTDYVLRSTQAIFTPLASLLVVTLVVVLAHQLVLGRAAARHPAWWRRATVATAVVALVLLALGVAALARLPPLQPVAGALSLGAGAALLEYAVWMLAADEKVPEPVRATLHQGRFLRGGVLAAVVLLALFWWTANVANSNGLATARAIEGSLVVRSEAVVLSTRPLAVSGYGVEVERLPPGAGFHFRHTGLRVLAHTGERWILLPVGWRRDNGAVLVLLPEQEDGVRVDVRP